VRRDVRRHGSVHPVHRRRRLPDGIADLRTVHVPAGLAALHVRGRGGVLNEKRLLRKS
jgi:hypothetical protein